MNMSQIKQLADQFGININDLSTASTLSKEHKKLLGKITPEQFSEIEKQIRKSGLLSLFTHGEEALSQLKEEYIGKGDTNATKSSNTKPSNTKPNTASDRASGSVSPKACGTSEKESKPKQKGYSFPSSAENTKFELADKPPLKIGSLVMYDDFIYTVTDTILTSTDQVIGVELGSITNGNKDRIVITLADAEFGHLHQYSLY